jgi:hypothetical protein
MWPGSAHGEYLVECFFPPDVSTCLHLVQGAGCQWQLAVGPLNTLFSLRTPLWQAVLWAQIAGGSALWPFDMWCIVVKCGE